MELANPLAPVDVDPIPPSFDEGTESRMLQIVGDTFKAAAVNARNDVRRSHLSIISPVVSDYVANLRERARQQTLAAACDEYWQAKFNRSMPEYLAGVVDDLSSKLGVAAGIVV